MNILFEAGTGILINFAYQDEATGFFFQGKSGDLLADETHNTIQIGLGKKADLDTNTFQKALYQAGKSLKSKEVPKVIMPANPTAFSDEEYVCLAIEALYLSQYSFTYYQKTAKAGIETLYFSEAYARYAESVQEWLTLLESQAISRDLVNLRSNTLTPAHLAERVSEIFQDTDVSVSIDGPDAIRAKGLTAFLEVARGSEEEPRFILMEYKGGSEDEQPTVLVGKGITYDTGGYSLKPSASMSTMHSDMGGAGTVIGAMRAIAFNGLKQNVIGIVAATENAVSGKAYKPGEVITARNGMTIEVDNTDAEGRLTLADAVHYGADVYQPKLLIDLATLTGAALVALGETYTALVTNNEEALASLQAAAKHANEKVWELPNDDVYRESFKSDIADLKNTGGRLAGTITAGQFIEPFVEETPWVHMDIAGTAYLSKPQGLYEKGATGVHVKTLYHLIKGM
ncbi:leucyl aminopeptidase [Suicoccus acidiformans]|uniref:Probable cytosol aminopeptidase n=1 Tax=Suicoccus acidiformans TaxID=2036206 RepID=A0A347WN23_9LACT|nr:leucyl aminopeptidase [Suicoccus acidiformans]AXY26480.1 leucyl aminopeptidase [Suicoccus acidiformans]